MYIIYRRNSSEFWACGSFLILRLTESLVLRNPKNRHCKDETTIQIWTFCNYV